MQFFLDFVKGLLAEVAEFEHPVLGSDAELAESLDVRIVQAVHSADGEVEDFNILRENLEELLVLVADGRQRVVIAGLRTHEGSEMILQDLGGLFDGVFGGDSSVV